MSCIQECVSRDFNLRSNLERQVSFSFETPLNDGLECNLEVFTQNDPYVPVQSLEETSEDGGVAFDVAPLLAGDYNYRLVVSGSILYDGRFFVRDFFV